MYVFLSIRGLARLTRSTGPGDFLEVRKILPLLTAKSADQPSFHVVALDLPGFGFSEAPKKPGFAGRQYAEVRSPKPAINIWEAHAQLYVACEQPHDLSRI